MIRLHLHAVHTRNFLSMTKALENKGRPFKTKDESLFHFFEIYTFWR